MKELSAFDIIGPVMIGPSSSHTAGALRIAYLASSLVAGRVIHARFTLYGSFARTSRGHGTDRALVAGVCGFSSDDPRIRDSFFYAALEGITYDFVLDFEDKSVGPLTLDVLIETEDGDKTLVRGESLGGGAVVIRKINDVAVQYTGEHNTIIVKQRDCPGMLAFIAGCMRDYALNIVTTNMYREGVGGIAYTIMETDEEIPREIVKHLEEDPDIDSALIVKPI